MTLSVYDHAEERAWRHLDSCKRGLRAKPKRVPARVGVDEKAISKWARDVTLVCDLDSSSVEYVAEDWCMESLDGYFGGFPATQLAGIRAIAMDMWPPYISSTLRHVPGARDKIVFDLYHIMSYMNEAVDGVRKREHREYRARGASGATIAPAPSTKTT